MVNLIPKFVKLKNGLIAYSFRKKSFISRNANEMNKLYLLLLNMYAISTNTIGGLFLNCYPIG